MRRNLMRLLMLPVFALCTTLVACEQAGDLTGPGQKAPSTANANLVGLTRVKPDTLVQVRVDSVDVGGGVVQGASAYAIIIPE